ncbi:MAG: hypothetical protein ACE5JO_02510, partial [Candidatus Binatia bacterium]
QQGWDLQPFGEEGDEPLISFSQDPPLLHLSLLHPLWAERSEAEGRGHRNVQVPAGPDLGSKHF